MPAVIEVKNLQKTYPARGAGRKLAAAVEAVRDVSFKVEQGEIFGILGPNGAGKTTTLEIIEGLKQQSSGQVVVLGLDNLTDPAQIKRRIGVQLQSSEYLNYLNLSELLILFGSLYDRRPDPKQLLGFVGIQDKATSRVPSLSGGQKQRFTIANSLVNEPEILFLDEPTTGLDPRARRDVWKLIKEINARGVTIVLTTHYMEEAEYLCHRVAIMDLGKILIIENPRKLIDNLSHTTQVAFFTDIELGSEFLQTLPSVKKVFSSFPKVILEIDSLDTLPKILSALQGKKVSYTGFTVKTATLEDVYLDLTGHEFED